MRRRQRDEPAGLLFNGKTYATVAERDRAVAVWRERRERWQETVDREAG
ncbi:MAG: hypothetical protein QG671_1940 [Actinomycetota bacterium]|nr:hypothetical protein [Actinomycetota bacterium]